MPSSGSRHNLRVMRSSIDEIIDLYKKDVDRTLIRENLKLTTEERLMKAQQMAQMAEELREAGREARRRRQLRFIAVLSSKSSTSRR